MFELPPPSFDLSNSNFAMTQHIGTQHTALPKNAQSWRKRVRQHEETWRPASVHSAESGMGIPILTQ